MDARNSTSSRNFAEPETVLVRPLLLKPQWMNGLSERLLVSHYVNNYGGALRRLNAIRARLTTLDWEGAPVFEINGLKREELIATGSVILHEIYFDSLGGYGDNPPTGLTEPPAELACALGRDFSSLAAWRTQFVAMAKALAGGSGWAILAWSERLGRLVNHWAADHGHALPSSTPILAIDMYEHAYHLDFGARAAAYVDQVMANLNWERIGARSRRAVGERTREDELFLPCGAPAQQEARISAEELKAALEESEDHRPVLLDLSAQGLAPTHRYAGRGNDARPRRPAVVDRGFAARPADCGLLYLRFPGQRHGRNRTAAERLRRQGSRRRHYGLACNRRNDRAAGCLHLRGGDVTPSRANFDAACDCPGDPAASPPDGHQPSKC